MDEVRTGKRTDERAALTDGERAALAALDARDRARAPDPDHLRRLDQVRRRAARHTRELLAAVVPDLEERRAALVREDDDLSDLKGLGTVRSGRSLTVGDVLGSVSDTHLGGGSVVADPLGTVGNLLEEGPKYAGPGTQPPHAGEFWWADTRWGTDTPEGSLAIDVNEDPVRIWGHLGHTADELSSFHVNVVLSYVLAPERLPRTSRTWFDLRPVIRLGGIVSGWTGAYHPIWHADDKWCKCWHQLTLDLTTSTGVHLAGDLLHQPVLQLANVEPVGQESISEFFGWTPVLNFSADLRALRREHVSLVLRAAVRYDIQLEGESDIWFRHTDGPASVSVPGFDNALTIRCSPGFLPTY